MVSAQIAVSPGCLLLLVEPVVEDGAGLEHQLKPIPGSSPAQFLELERKREPCVGV